MLRLKRINWQGWFSFGLLLLLWEISSRSTPKLQFYFPPVSRVVVALVQMALAGSLVQHLGTTFGRFLVGYALAAILGVFFGMLLGYFGSLRSLLAIVIEFLRPMPSVAIIPVAVLMLGIGDSMIVAVTVYASIWPILVNTIDGVRHIETVLIQTGRTFGLNRNQLLRQIILPAASPYIVTGLRIGLSIALILVTTAEMIIGSNGIGFFILDEERAMNSSNMYAGIVLVALLGYLLNQVFLIAEARMMKWHHGISARGEV
jgi:ABC-type nitrate/sulfonate/bicarbonate transport system permease component